MEAAPLRIAMWSGPRNISTAMMRAFENREDCVVVDEPFYAAYLARTGIDHPMREEVLSSQPQDPSAVVASLLGPLPDGASVFYQKHMTHHMIDSIDLAWIPACANVFLIRAPARVVASYARKRSEANLADLGFVRQAELFDREADRLGRAPLVIDADDVLTEPHGLLQALCVALAIPFSEKMLRWSAGRRGTDGVWAAHWYQSVEASTGFSGPAALPGEDLPEEMRPAEEIYRRLHAFRLKA
jgi:hypothetical protein